jgi:uncharacterized repeat protein (TIGR02543 family)
MKKAMIIKLVFFVLALFCCTGGIVLLSTNFLTDNTEIEQVQEETEAGNCQIYVYQNSCWIDKKQYAGYASWPGSPGSAYDGSRYWSFQGFGTSSSSLSAEWTSGSSPHWYGSVWDNYYYYAVYYRSLTLTCAFDTGSTSRVYGYVTRYMSTSGDKSGASQVSVTLPGAPSKTFSKWKYYLGSIALTYDAGATFSKIVSYDDVWCDFTATWSANSYTIYFDQQSGSGGSTSATATYNSYPPSITKPSRSGYTFQGYYTSTGGGGTQYYNSSGSSTRSYTTAGNMTLYAYWTKDTYSISYNLDGGSVSGNPTSYQVDTASFTLKNPTKTGYNFDGWSGTGISGTSTSVTVSKGSTGNRSYTANWSVINYNISYTLNNGSVSGTNPTSYNITTNTFTLINPTRTGYTFTGWSGTGISGTSTSVSVAKGSTGARSYTANWSANTYTIGYSLGGGSHGTNHPTSGTYDTAVQISNPTRTGYTFDGWTFNGNTSTAKYGEDDSTSSSWNSTSTKVKTTYFKNLTPTNNATVTLTANWVPITYTVVFNGNGGKFYDSTDPTYSQTMTYDQSANLTANKYEKSGYTFAGWRNEAGTTTYTDGQSVSNLTSTGNATINLYANWTAISWVTTGNTTAPSGNGTASSPYLIATAENLAWFANQVNSGNTNIVAEQTAPIDLSAYYWDPIGDTSSHAFTGVYTGECFEISGLNVYGKTNDGVLGLFGYVGAGATITKLNISSANIGCGVTSASGTRYEGIIAGKNVSTGSNVGITDCYVNGSITSSSTTKTGDTLSRGALVGSNTGKIDGCYAAAEGVSVVVGTNTGTVTNCYLNRTYESFTQEELQSLSGLFWIGNIKNT